MLQRYYISIHAPLRERQGDRVTGAMKFLTFQSTLPCGSDAKMRYLLVYMWIFQSTLPCGSDIAFFRESLVSKHFNPRSLAGATLIFIIELCEPRFQSTLPCGSDSGWLINHDLKLTFQSTLPCGSDPGLFEATAAHRYFNPRSLAGATRASGLVTPKCAYFNPRSLAGATKVSFYHLIVQ